MSNIAGKSPRQLASMLVGTVRTLGVLDTVWLATRSEPEAALMARDALRDRRLGVDTTAPVVVEQQSFVGEHAEEAERYYPTNNKVLESIFRTLNITYEDWTFIDVGCGKGRALLCAAERPFKKVIGVESSLTTTQVARDNVGRLAPHLKCRDVEVVNCDIVDFELPRENVVLYLYNPFIEGSDVYGRLLRRVQRALEDGAPKMYIAYSCPVSRLIFDNCGFLRRVYERKTLVGDYDWILYEARRL